MAASARIRSTCLCACGKTHARHSCTLADNACEWVHLLPERRKGSKATNWLHLPSLTHKIVLHTLIGPNVMDCVTLHPRYHDGYGLPRRSQTPCTPLVWPHRQRPLPLQAICTRAMSLRAYRTLSVQLIFEPA
eukprot:4336199-Amphidinium_carterae.1